MIPVEGEDIELTEGEEIEEYDEPSLTYCIRFNPVDEGKTIIGYLDEIEAVKQSCRLILTTERYEYPIYSDDYGIELADLFGEPFDYVYAELKRRIEEALLQDERILSIEDYNCVRSRESVTASFRVVTIYGVFEEEVEAMV